MDQSAESFFALFTQDLVPCYGPQPGNSFDWISCTVCWNAHGRVSLCTLLCIHMKFIDVPMSHSAEFG